MLFTVIKTAQGTQVYTLNTEAERTEARAAMRGAAVIKTDIFFGTPFGADATPAGELFAYYQRRLVKGAEQERQP